MKLGYNRDILLFCGFNEARTCSSLQGLSELSLPFFTEQMISAGRR